MTYFCMVKTICFCTVMNRKIKLTISFRFYNQKSVKEQSKESLAERSQREDFSSELVYSLLSPEFADISIENQSEKIEHKENGKSDVRTLKSVVLNNETRELTLLQSDACMVDGDAVCATNVASQHNGSEDSSFQVHDEPLLRKQLSNSDVVTLVSDEPNGDRSSIS